METDEKTKNLQELLGWFIQRTPEKQAQRFTAFLDSLPWADTQEGIDNQIEFLHLMGDHKEALYWITVAAHCDRISHSDDHVRLSDPEIETLQPRSEWIASLDVDELRLALNRLCAATDLLHAAGHSLLKILVGRARESRRKNAAKGSANKPASKAMPKVREEFLAWDQGERPQYGKAGQNKKFIAAMVQEHGVKASSLTTKISIWRKEKRQSAS